DGIRAGEIVDIAGRVLGHHQGLPFYTVGQRRGLGLVSPEKLYVVALDAEKNRVIVGPEQELYSRGLVASEVKWPAERPPAELEVEAKIRYRSPPVASAVVPRGKDNLEVTFK
ncbi:MAG: tRNA 2-thiouridine(34) synthase MnmA, partial [Thermoplasmata archaeon]|nr:tRNA 2-thiouridine(34) synthase MnmA [Thermoplasmata archaeon]NIY05160.1 tRNA 2-thiouridine(34) synthase MnmA [Thermoplasmata archaeon]